MKKRKVKGLKQCACGNLTNIQIYDFVNNIWVWYCEKCQSPIDDPNSP